MRDGSWQWDSVTDREPNVSAAEFHSLHKTDNFQVQVQVVYETTKKFKKKH